MRPDLLLPVSLIMGLIVFSLAAKWYVLPHMKHQTRSTALTPLLLFHSLRYLGLAFLVPGVTAATLDPRFSHPAAYGDFATAGLALVSLLAIRRHWGIATLMVWIFNIVGTLDLINALVTGVVLAQNLLFGATYFIPVLIVPALLVSHAVIFILLVRRESTA